MHSNMMFADRLYGEHVFPLQVATLLSEPGEDFAGGEFVLTEQRPRMQTRAAVAPLRKGDAVVFAVNSRPVRGARGSYRVNMRHGVSKLRSGHRHTLGIIFHDAVCPGGPSVRLEPLNGFANPTIASSLPPARHPR
jgi:hypothetical protein